MLRFGLSCTKFSCFNETFRHVKSQFHCPLYVLFLRAYLLSRLGIRVRKIKAVNNEKKVLAFCSVRFKRSVFKEIRIEKFYFLNLEW